MFTWRSAVLDLHRPSADLLSRFAHLNSSPARRISRSASGVSEAAALPARSLGGHRRQRFATLAPAALTPLRSAAAFFSSTASSLALSRSEAAPAAPPSAGTIPRSPKRAPRRPPPPLPIVELLQAAENVRPEHPGPPLHESPPPRASASSPAASALASAASAFPLRKSASAAIASASTLPAGSFARVGELAELIRVRGPAFAPVPAGQRERRPDCGEAPPRRARRP